MSYTTILGFKMNESMDSIEELQNAWGSAPAIWDYVAKKHFHGENWMTLATGPYKEKFWASCYDDRLSRCEQVVFMMTFTRVYTPKAHYAKAARDIRDFLAMNLVDAKCINHWPRIAEILESDPDYDAIGIHHTSVSENPFAEFNEETEEYDVLWDKMKPIYVEVKDDD